VQINIIIIIQQLDPSYGLCGLPAAAMRRQDLKTIFQHTNSE